VFDIQQGVAIGIFIKRQENTTASLGAKVHYAQLWGPREVYEKALQTQHLIGGKYYWLAENDIKSTRWIVLDPQMPYYLFKPQNTVSKSEYESGWKITDILSVNSTGVKTHRDHFVVDIDESIFHHDNIVELPRYELMYHMLVGDNLGIATTREVEIGRGWEHVLCSSKII